MGDDADSPKNICSTIWNAIQHTDATPEQDFIEVYFGVGAPYDGAANDSLIYQLSSIRNDDLVLISQNPCKQFCPDYFPRCYRFGGQNLCGQSFERSLNGLKTALRDVEKIHRNSATRLQPMWAVLVMYDESGKEEILYTWEDIEDPLVRCLAPTASGRSGSAFSRWWAQKKTIVIILLGITVLIFLVLIVSILTKKRKKEAAEAGEAEEKGKKGGRGGKEKKEEEKGGKEKKKKEQKGEPSAESLEEQTLEEEAKAEEMSWIGLPGTQAPLTI